MKRFAAALLLLAVTGCSSQSPTTGWPFDPIAFFSGRTHGEATLHVLLRGSHRIVVDGIGKSDGHGGLILDQRIREEDKAPRVRRWVLHPAGPNRWTGTLTDAQGPVTVESTASGVHIHYRMHSGPQVEQWLQRPPNSAVSNRLTVSRWGIRLAWLDETIRKRAQ